MQVIATVVLKVWGALATSMPLWAPTAAKIAAYVITIGSTIAYGSAQSRKMKKRLAASLANLDTGRNITAREAIGPRRIVYGQVLVGGNEVFIDSNGSSNEYLYRIIKVADHECEELGDVYFDDAVVPLDGSGNATGTFAGYATVRKYLGLAAGERDTTLETDSGGTWTANHLGKSVARLHVKLKHSVDVFPNGAPNIRCLVKGRKVYDPRTATTVYSNNAALCAADYLMDAKYGKGVPLSRINVTALIEAANVCDEAVALNPSGTEARYTCNGVINSDEDPNDVLAELANCMAGVIVDSGGIWTIHAGAYRTPTLTLTDDELCGGFSVSPRLSRQDTYNGVRGTFYSPENQWAAADFPAVINDTYKAADGGVRLWKDVAYRFTTSSATAQRLAKIDLEKNRQQITIQGRYMLKAMQCQPGDVIKITRSRLGWNEKLFEVTGWRFVIENQADNPALAIELTARETASAVYDWNSGEQTIVDLAPNTTLVNPRAAGTPAGLTLTSSYFEQEDGTVFPRLKVSWNAATLEQVKSGGFVWIEYKKAADSTWLIWGSVRGDATEDYITDVLIGTSYNVRIRFQNTFQAYSAYSSTATATPAGDTTAPGQVTGLDATGGAGFISLIWTPIDKSMYPDFAEYAVYRNTSNNFATAVVVAEVGASAFIDPNVTVGTTYYYWVTASDRSENESVQSLVDSAVATAALSTVAPSTPSAPTYSAEGTYVAGDGTALAYVTVSTPALPSGAIVMDVLYRVSGSSSWIIANQVNGVTTSRIDDLATNTTYEFAMRGVSNGGALSAVSSTLSRTTPVAGAPSGPASGSFVAGDTTSEVRPPPVIDSGNLLYAAIIKWSASTSRDVAFYDIIGTAVNSDASADLIYDVNGPDVRVVGKDNLKANYYRLTNATLYIRIRAYNTSFARSGWVALGDISSYLKRPAGDMTGQNANAIAVTGGSAEDVTLEVDSVKTGSVSASSVREVVARYPHINTAYSLTGGSPSENIDVSLSNRGFSTKPDYGTAAIISGNDAWGMRYDYNSASSTSTNARLVVYTLDGSNLPSGTTGFTALFEEYN